MGRAVGLILLPLVAMQFTSEVVWTASDFVFAMVMFGGVGLGLELAARTKNRAFTMAVAIALLVLPGTVRRRGRDHRQRE